MDKSILLNFVHPDDEAGCAALVKRYVAEGAKATLICATNGEVGTVEDTFLEKYASITELRLAELACATQAAGYTEVITWGYRDSGMMGSKDNYEASSLWQAPLEEVTSRVAEVMRRTRPQVVITFNTFGMYGHPDHIKINQATLAAFEQLQSEPEHPQKLYYVTIPTLLVRLFLIFLKLRRQDPRKAGTNHDMDFIAAFDALTPVTARVPVSNYIEANWAVQDCYASQIHISPRQRLLRRLFGRQLQGSVALSRVYPVPRPGERIEHDLFENVIELTADLNN